MVRVETFEDAIALINAHQYGNGTCLFTRNGEAGLCLADVIEVGMVGINVPLSVLSTPLKAVRISSLQIVRFLSVLFHRNRFRVV